MTQYTYWVTAIKQTIWEIGREVANPLFFKLVGSISHTDNVLWICVYDATDITAGLFTVYALRCDLYIYIYLYISILRRTIWCNGHRDNTETLHALLALCEGNPQGLPRKWSVMQKGFLCHDVTRVCCWRWEIKARCCVVFFVVSMDKSPKHSQMFGNLRCLDVTIKCMWTM